MHLFCVSHTSQSPAHLVFHRPELKRPGSRATKARAPDRPSKRRKCGAVFTRVPHFCHIEAKSPSFRQMCVTPANKAPHFRQKEGADQ